MTIAFGVLCQDGIVLGADGEYTRDWLKTQGQKIFTVCNRDGLSIVAAASGNPDLAKRAALLLKSYFEEATDCPVLSEISDIAERAISKVFREHVYIAPPERYADLYFDFILGICAKGIGPVLLSSGATVLTPVGPYQCHGSGEHVGQFLLKTILGDYPTLDHATQVATYIIEQAMRSVSGVGQPATVRFITLATGAIGTLRTSEMSTISRNFDGLLSAFRRCVSSIDSTVDDSIVETQVGLLKEQIGVLRAESQRRDRGARGAIEDLLSE